MYTILIIEDESELARVLRSYLEKAGMNVLVSNRGDTGLEIWEKTNPDLVILDLNLPGMDGLDIAYEIRRRGTTPIIMVTARVEEEDRLMGLEIGADDYVTKPYSPREVVARVKVVLRRAGSVAVQSRRLQLSDLEIDLDDHSVHRMGQNVDLTPTEFNLLSTMAAQPGRAFSRLQLLEAVQGTAYEGYERTIDAHIKNLRAKLQGNYIQTVFGVGYRLTRE
jgi:two-component system alkaline phosphatase synthesis response regulator PhoP